MPEVPESGAPAPQGREPRGVPGSGSTEDTLRRLEQRLDQASAAAERLMAQAAAAAARAGNPAAGAGRSQGAGNPGPGAGNPGPEASESHDAGDPRDPPAAGWQTAEESSRGHTSELDPFVALVQAMRDLIPPDLQQRLIAALREVLLALRALIDWYLERIERRREQGVEIQDIPIL